LLAAIGLYGLLAYSVARRTNEIGIRMALGANRMDVIRMVVGEAALTVAAGLAVGIPVALAGGKAAGRIFGDLPPEGAPIAIFGAVAMFAVAAVAAYVPARRAVRVAPVEALRYE
jgi:ABC-type antimicrobial peptide transport system permease subunit